MPLVSCEDHGAVRHVVLDRPRRRNALGRDLVAELGVALRAADGDPAVRCVVVRGAGPAFSAGADLGDLAQLAREPGRVRELRDELLAVWSLCEEMPKPTIAQIHGACLGAGLELALACDLRVAALDAVMGLPEVRAGIVPDVGGCSRLPALVGLGRAKELVLTGRVVDGATAERMGLVNRAVPPAGLAQATAELAAELVACAPLAVGLAKRVLDAAAKPALALTLEQEVEAQARCAASADFAEGASALGERRPPRFSGR